MGRVVCPICHKFPVLSISKLSSLDYFVVVGIDCGYCGFKISFLQYPNLKDTYLRRYNLY